LRSPIADTSAPHALALGRRSQSSGLRKVAAALPEIKLNGALERARFNVSDFTDMRCGSPYSYDPSIVQMFVSATFWEGPQMIIRFCTAMAIGILVGPMPAAWAQDKPEKGRR
jgi:hypothetical protein